MSCCQSSCQGRRGRRTWFIHEETVQFSSWHRLCFINLDWRLHEGNFWSYMHACSLAKKVGDTHTRSPPENLTGVSHFVHWQRHHLLRGTHTVKSEFKNSPPHMFPTAGGGGRYQAVQQCMSFLQPWIIHKARGHLGNLPGLKKPLSIVWQARCALFCFEAYQSNPVFATLYIAWSPNESFLSGTADPSYYRGGCPYGEKCREREGMLIWYEQRDD